MELAIDDLLACFPAYLDGNERSRSCLKKKIGRILSIKARSLNVSEDNLIKVKAIVYNKINVKVFLYLEISCKSSQKIKKNIKNWEEKRNLF